MELDVTEMRDAYLKCALWTATGDDGEPLEKQFDVDDFDENTKTEALSVCAQFAETHSALLQTVDRDEGMDASQAGHDLWLTRNRHGAGFWEQEWGSAGDALTEAAHQLGEADVFVSEEDEGEAEDEPSRYLYIASC